MDSLAAVMTIGGLVIPCGYSGKRELPALLKLNTKDFLRPVWMTSVPYFYNCNDNNASWTEKYHCFMFEAKNKNKNQLSKADFFNLMLSSCQSVDALSL